MIPELLEFTHGISREFDKAILKVEGYLAWEDEEKALKYLGKGWNFVNRNGFHEKPP